MSVGVNLVDGRDLLNSRFCMMKMGDQIVRYTPYEVKEYGFKDGRVYLSKDIQTSDSVQRVFLERLEKGNTTLYYYKGKRNKTYFLEKDSILFVELPKRKEKRDITFRSNLQHITSDCPNVRDAAKLVNYNKKSLTNLITRYNNCELKPFPFFKYGLIIGYGTTKLIPSSAIENEYINQLDFKYDGGFTIGLFVDNPILVSDFSLHAELYYSRHGFSYNKLIENKDIDFVANISALKLPILIKYAYPSNKNRPFINAGGILAYNFKNDNSLYEASMTQNIIEIDDLKKTSLIYRNQVGYSIGGGLECKLNHKNFLFFELRYSKLYGLSDSGSLNNSEIHFITGINF